MFSLGSSWQGRRFVRLFAVLFIVILAAASTLLGQTTTSTGSIQGIVKDPSGALVADSTINITSQETGQTMHVRTTSGGLFTSGALTPGHYAVRVETKGFK